MPTCKPTLLLVVINFHDYAYMFSLGNLVQLAPVGYSQVAANEAIQQQLQNCQQQQQQILVTTGGGGGYVSVQLVSRLNRLFL